MIMTTLIVITNNTQATLGEYEKTMMQLDHHFSYQ